jgi:aspartate-semialdehyde dehydrogenase
MKTYTVGIVGATGAVGKEMIFCLHERKFPIETLRLFASQRSAGKRIDTPFGEMEIELFSPEKAGECHIVLMAVSGSFSQEYAPQVAEQGALVIDNSSAFRYYDNVPLVVPEVNAEAAKGAKLISNPNCTTAILAVALWPLHKSFGVKKCIVSTYQATSGAGQEAMDELEEQTKKFLNGESFEPVNFARPIAFNLIPRIDSMQDNNYTREEMKVVKETHKIFNDNSLLISCTAVRIPTFRAHAEAVTIETEKEITPQKATEVLAGAPGVEIIDAPENFDLPMPLTATKKYNVEVGRIRQNLIFGKYGLDFFICGDQLLKGAALNAVQIAESLI